MQYPVQLSRSAIHVVAYVNRVLDLAQGGCGQLIVALGFSNLVFSLIV